MIVGGQDGSVTILVVAQLEDEAMTNEEKILRKNYGANYESQVQLHDRGSSLMQNRKMGNRKVSTANMK